MSNDHQLSRVSKYKKRRSVKRSIITLSLLGTIILFGLFISFISGNDAKTAKDKSYSIEVNKSEEEVNPTVADNHENDADEQAAQQDDQQRAIDEEETLETEEATIDDIVDNESVEGKVVASEDPNVIKAIEGDWQPIGTVQEEPHESTFDKESVDWNEMVKAIESVVPLDDMTLHWLGNGGEQKAIGTVSTPDGSEIYRVYISWVAQEGWKPTRVEQLRQLEIKK